MEVNCTRAQRLMHARVDKGRVAMTVVMRNGETWEQNKKGGKGT